MEPGKWSSSRYIHQSNQHLYLCRLWRSRDLRFALDATDTQLSSSADVTALVNPPINQPPNVSVSASPSSVSLPNTTTTLNSTVSDDGLPNGTLTLQWTQISGPVQVDLSPHPRRYQRRSQCRWRELCSNSRFSIPC